MSRDRLNHDDVAAGRASARAAGVWHRSRSRSRTASRSERFVRDAGRGAWVATLLIAGTAPFPPRIAASVPAPDMAAVPRHTRQIAGDDVAFPIHTPPVGPPATATGANGGTHDEWTDSANDVEAENAGYTVVIDLSENRLYFRYGDVTLWSAPVATGTGMRLATETGEWDFSTPVGTYHVEFKELDPVWIAPDWYYHENGLPVPPRNHPSRYFPGGLGAAAVYFHPTLAIHGTNRPELLGQRISHGCIRLENRYVLRLYHNVQVGTRVVIIGSDSSGAATSPSFSPGDGPPPGDAVVQEWDPLPTVRLLETLDQQIAAGPDSRWDQIATLLIDRAARGDDEALWGIFRRARPGIMPPAIELEWKTFVAETYRRAAARSLAVLTALPPMERDVAARTLVEGSLDLFDARLDDPAAPWPSRRIPASLVPPDIAAGHDAVLAAELAFRSRHAESSSTAQAHR